jgi:ATP-dependent Lon protease
MQIFSWKVEKLHSKLSAAEEENLNLKLIHGQNTNEDMTELECKISQQIEEVFDLKTYSRSLLEQIKRLNSELSESKEKFDEEIDELQNKFKIEFKAWKKELGEERRMKINLENKLKHAAQEKIVPADKSRSNNTIEEDIIECTICAEPIPN